MERVVTFGRRSDQVGILALPSEEARAKQHPAVLMWNVGVNHRVGPFRVYVDLCRRLAASGYAAFRFDASGLGDSEVRREAVNETEREDLDIADAMDAVTRRTGIRSFILIGFCSSVDAAHRVSVRDERVVGVAHVEGYSFRSKGFQKRLPLRLLSVRRWERRAWLHLPQLFAELGPPLTAAAASIYSRKYPKWSDFSHDLEALTRRRVSLLFVYAGGDTDFNHRGQFWEMFGTPGMDRSRVSVVFYPEVDHTFYEVQGREKVLQQLVRWIQTVEGLEPGRRAAPSDPQGHSDQRE